MENRDALEVAEDLRQPLLDLHVKERRGPGGITLSYLEAWFVKEQANRIFGYGGWSTEITHQERWVGTERVWSTEEGKRIDVNRAKASAVVRVVALGTFHEDEGFGTGYDEHDREGAMKEAISDGIKRACTAFGDQFGLALYDKQQAGIESVRERQYRGRVGISGELMKLLKRRVGSRKQLVKFIETHLNEDGTLNYDSVLEELDKGR